MEAVIDIQIAAKRKRCSACGAKKIIERFPRNRNVCISCLNKRKTAARKKKIKNGFCAKCPCPREPDKTLCKACLEKCRESKIKLKKITLSHYGDICECCGEDNIHFLTIDHIYGFGNQHREELNGGGHKFYNWLKKHNYPQDGFRILCYNCNCGRQANGGICPHHEEHISGVRAPEGLIFR